MKVYWQYGQKQYQGRTGHQENMTTYAVNHFKPECFNEKPGRKSCQLHPYAVPSIFTSFPSYMCNHLENLLGNHQGNVQLLQLTKNIEPSSSKVKKAIQMDDHSYTTDPMKPTDASKEISTLQNEIRILK